MKSYILILIILLITCTCCARITPPPAGPITLDPEWAEREGIIVSYPWYPWFPYGSLFPTLAGMIDAIQEYGVVYIIVANEYQGELCKNDLTGFGVPWENIELIYYPSADDDEWTRDYGPWFVWEDDSTLSIVDQRYFDGQQLCDDFPDFLEEHWDMSYYGADIQNEGGNMMTDGHGTMMVTDHVFDVNPHLTVEEIVQIHRDYFAQDTVYIFEGLAGDQWNHIDGWAKILNDTTILVARMPLSDPNYQLIEDHAAFMGQIPTVYGTPFNIVRCQLPDPWYYTYLNSLMINGLALVPTYGFPNLDSQALACYQDALGPEWDVIGVDSYWISWLGGAIHCTTIGVPRHDQDYIVDVDLYFQPVSPPVTIPASGGSFLFDVELENLESGGITFDFWIGVTLPNGNNYGPLIKREGINMPPAGQIARELTQTIPASAPAGTYAFNTYVGSYIPLVVSAESSFDFEKLGNSDGESFFDEWFVSGWDDEISASTSNQQPSSFVVHSCYPNPFNPTTTIRFDLPVASQVKLDVFDINGRIVGAHGRAPLQYTSGTHLITFNGSNLASGIYLYRLQMSGSGAIPTIETGKMVLLK